MIEIKSVGGNVLFTAESATDARAAMVEAVKSRADLSGAECASGIHFWITREEAEAHL